MAELQLSRQKVSPPSVLMSAFPSTLHPHFLNAMNVYPATSPIRRSPPGYDFTS